jgi:hypothetical protein
MNPRQMKEYKAQQAKKNAEKKHRESQEKNWREESERMERERLAELCRMETGEYKGKWSVTRTETPLAGDCHEQMIAVWKKLGRLGAKMMLGETRSMAGEWRNFDCGRGMPLWHCWVEYQDMVYDTSQGQNILMPKEMYYTAFRVQTAMPYPITETASRNRKEGLCIDIRIPSPRELEFVRNIIRKQHRLGRREFPEDVRAIIGK